MGAVGVCRLHCTLGPGPAHRGAVVSWCLHSAFLLYVGAVGVCCLHCTLGPGPAHRGAVVPWRLHSAFLLYVGAVGVCRLHCTLGPGPAHRGAVAAWCLHNAKQSKAEQSRAKQSKAEQSRAKQSKPEQTRADHGRAMCGSSRIIYCLAPIHYHPLVELHRSLAAWHVPCRPCAGYCGAFAVEHLSKRSLAGHSGVLQAQRSIRA